MNDVVFGTGGMLTALPYSSEFPVTVAEFNRLESSSVPSMPGEEAELQIRPVFEAEDLGEEFTPELREREAQLRRELEQKQKQS